MGYQTKEGSRIEEGKKAHMMMMMSYTMITAMLVHILSCKLYAR
jgi:hypothetical protein